MCFRSLKLILRDEEVIFQIKLFGVFLNLCFSKKVFGTINISRGNCSVYYFHSLHSLTKIRVRHTLFCNDSSVRNSYFKI